MMQGPHAAKRFVTNYLERDLPQRLLLHRNAWNLSEDDLPNPLKYLNYEPIAIDHWPTVITLAISASDMSRNDYDTSLNPLYRIRYSMRTYAWVKEDGSDECTTMRDNLITVVRSALLDHVSLRTADNQGCNALIDEGSMREEYSDLTLIKGDRVMAGAYVAYEMELNETITRKPISTSLTSVEVDAEVSVLANLLEP
jgi:hypothetical protein